MRSNRVAAVMPDHGRRAEAQRAAVCLQAAAKIYIIARYAKLRIEPMDGHDRRLSKGHVAPGNVLRDFIGKQYVYWPAGSIRDAIGDSPITTRGEVGTTDSHMRCLQERVDQIGH